MRDRNIEKSFGINPDDNPEIQVEKIRKFVKQAQLNQKSLTRDQKIYLHKIIQEAETSKIISRNTPNLVKNPPKNINAWIIITTIFLAPIGLLLIWKYRKDIWKNKAVRILLIIWAVIFCLFGLAISSNQPELTTVDNSAKTVPTTTESSSVPVDNSSPSIDDPVPNNDQSTTPVSTPATTNSTSTPQQQPPLRQQRIM
jgi:glucan phosphoethanolaminetransferase (alkaline phosphatase superfamily)